MGGEESKSWVIELGLYPGILIGFRTYPEADVITHVLYLPFVDIAFIIER
jgi:hypothetical protein